VEGGVRVILCMGNKRVWCDSSVVAKGAGSNKTPTPGSPTLHPCLQNQKRVGFMAKHRGEGSTNKVAKLGEREDITHVQALIHCSLLSIGRWWTRGHS